MRLTREDLEMIAAMIADATGATPVIPDPPEPGEPSSALTFAAEGLERLLDKIAVTYSDEKLVKLDEGFAHYCRMFQAFDDQPPTDGEKAVALALAIRVGTMVNVFPRLAEAEALYGLLRGTLGKGIGAPKVRILVADPLTGRTERPMNASEEWLADELRKLHPDTGSGGTWSGPPEAPKKP